MNKNKRCVRCKEVTDEVVAFEGWRIGDHEADIIEIPLCLACYMKIRKNEEE